MNKRNGFTLIEILIVVVILAVLAAMILPRLVQQSENGYIAEAQQNLGGIRSAMVTAIDRQIFTSWQDFDNAAFQGGTTGLPLKAMADDHWTYECFSATTKCTATRQGGSFDGFTITLTEGGTFSCTGYQFLSASKGCRV